MPRVHFRTLFAFDVVRQNIIGFWLMFSLFFYFSTGFAFRNISDFAAPLRATTVSALFRLVSPRIYASFAFIGTLYCDFFGFCRLYGAPHPAEASSALQLFETALEASGGKQIVPSWRKKISCDWGWKQNSRGADAVVRCKQYRKRRGKTGGEDHKEGGQKVAG